MSLLNDTTVITDLKEAQNRTNGIVLFKNHEKKYQKILPIQQLNQYGPGQVLEISVKGQGVDYINFNGSCLWVLLSYSANAYLPFSTMGLISRFQFRSGTYDFQDIFGYGIWLWHEQRGGMKRGFEDYVSNWDESYGWPGIGNDRGNANWFRIPLVTALDGAGYFPIYNLAEDLRIRLTLAPYLEAVSHSVAEGVVTQGEYQIWDAYFLADGLTGVSGSNLDDTPYKYHALNCIGFRDSIGQLDNGIWTKKVSYDIKKTSLKSCLSVIKPAFSTVLQNVTNSQWSKGISSGWFYSLPNEIWTYNYQMGGINFPFKNGVEDLNQGWIQYEKRFHRQDLMPLTTNFTVTYDEYTTIPNFTGTRGDNCMYADFDRLDQTTDIISGIDSERYPVQLVVSQEPFIRDYQFEMHTWFTYDIILMLTGGEIKIDD